jgi:pyruvate,water dikinase
VASPKTFPLPSTVAVIEGTEAAQAMYPYFMQFTAADDDRFWFYNAMHFGEPIPAFDTITGEGAYAALGSFNTRVFVIPTAKGIDQRIINGRVYISGNIVTDPEEIGRRAQLFRERAFYYYEHWEELYDNWRRKMAGLIDEAKAIEVPSLPDYDDLDSVHAGRGIAQNHFVLKSYQQAIEGYFRMWQHHFEFLLLGYGAYMVFFDFCKKAFPEIADQTVARMVAGFDAEMFQPDNALKRLARKAVELEVDGKFVEGEKPEDILAALGQMGEPGRRWLEALEAEREPWFNVGVGDGFYHYHRSWNDDLSIPFSGLVGYIGQLKAGGSIDRPTLQLKAERERLISEHRELLYTDEERAAFDQMIGLSHRVFPYVEDHKFYCEHWYTQLFFNKIREFGALLQRNRFFADAEDVFHLTRFEVEAALADLSTAWSNGSAPRGPDYWPPIVEARKAALSRLADFAPSPALGPVPEQITDPAIIMLWGITTESLRSWLNADELAGSGEIRGFAASNGVVEGIARVVRTVDEIARIQEGDILVCHVTNPSWAPIFRKIRAAVSDIGGSMSHAAIVAREYGLPAVVGTGTATQRIADGQRIRVDGGTGIVTILG